MKDFRRRALALSGTQQAAQDWYRVGPVLALADDDDSASSTSADVYVYDTIGGWFGMTADDFVRDVAGLDVDQLVIHLNSPGGSADEGVAIANVLRAHPARVVVRVDGIAASAASAIAMAGDEVVMSIGSQLMIHDAWSWAAGDAAEMEKAARMLHSTSNALAQAYAAKAGGTAAEWREAMQQESWYGPDEAVAAGLADRAATADETGTARGEQITPGSSSGSFWDLWDSLGSPDRHDLSAYRYAGRQNAPAPVMPGRTTPAASAAGRNPTERSGSMPTFLDDVRSRLGTPDDADEAAVLAALDTRLNQPAAAATPPGTRLVDSEQYAQLEARARRGDEARAQQEREGREREVDAAIQAGRIAPSQRAAWLTQLETNPGSAEVLAALPAVIPVDGPRGHSEAKPDAGEAAPSLKAGADLYNSRRGKKG